MGHNVLPSFSGKMLFLPCLCTKSYADSNGKSYGNLYTCRRYIFISYIELYTHLICSKSYSDLYGKSRFGVRQKSRSIFCSCSKSHTKSHLRHQIAAATPNHSCDTKSHLRHQIANAIWLAISCRCM
jgi:hypothetical protein